MGNQSKFTKFKALLRGNGLNYTCRFVFYHKLLARLTTPYIANLLYQQNSYRQLRRYISLVCNMGVSNSKTA